MAAGSLTPHAAKQATTTVPIVITNHADPVGSGLVASLAAPGGNITGLSLLTTELLGKQLEILKEAVPRLIRVAVLWNPTSQTHPRLLGEESRRPGSWAFSCNGCPHAASMTMNRPSRQSPKRARTPSSSSVTGSYWYHRTRIAELATKARLPTMFGGST